jgi:D-aspartate ligase
MPMIAKSIPGVVVIEGHVQGLSNTRAFGEAGIPVYVIDKSNCLARYSKYCKKFFTCPDFQSGQFIDYLIDLGKKESIIDWLLMPSNDHAVYSISLAKKKLERIYKIITPDDNIVNNIYNKRELISNAAVANIPYPDTHFPEIRNETIPVSLNFPVLVKGVFGLSFYKATGKKAFIAKSNPELKGIMDAIFNKLKPSEVLIQELIPLTGTNKTISFCAFCINGEVKSYWMGKKIREHPLEFGTATLAESVFIKEIVSPAKSLLHQLNYTGPCEVEFILDPRDNQYKLIEVNARTWLWVELARQCGIDFAMMSYNFVNGINQEYPDAYTIGVRWINIFTDIPVSILSILSLKVKPSLKFSRSAKKNTINALWKKDDVIPFFIYPILLFSFLHKR